MKIIYTESTPPQTVSYNTPVGPNTITIPGSPGAQKEIDIDDATVAVIAAALNPATAPFVKLTPSQLAAQYSKNDLFQAALLSTT